MIILVHIKHFEKYLEHGNAKKKKSSYNYYASYLRYQLECFKSITGSTGFKKSVKDNII